MPDRMSFGQCSEIHLDRWSRMANLEPAFMKAVPLVLASVLSPLRTLVTGGPASLLVMLCVVTCFVVFIVRVCSVRSRLGRWSPTVGDLLLFCAIVGLIAFRISAAMARAILLLSIKNQDVDQAVLLSERHILWWSGCGILVIIAFLVIAAIAHRRPTTNAPKRPDAESACDSGHQDAD
jgi:hypothetical protein